ncbi:MAG: glycerol-3-phosphate 1-O-acyltransferase PlsY [Vulcanimicrobiaceae bacterium]
MNKLGRLTLAALGGFAVGSIPFGVVASRLIFKSDIREQGSGNIGAANALRTYGKGFGATILVLDALKGAAPALLAAELDGPAAAAAAGTGAVLGHCYTPWLNFRGGKGVATFLGAVFALSPKAGLGFMLVWLAAVVPTRYSSLGSLLGSALAPFAVYLDTRDRNAAAELAVATAVIFYKHRENIARLRRGKEHKLRLGSRPA